VYMQYVQLGIETLDKLLNLVCNGLRFSQVGGEHHFHGRLRLFLRHVSSNQEGKSRSGK